MMFWEATAFDQDLGWCVDDDVDFDSEGEGSTFQDAFAGTPCASASCGVVQLDDCDTPTPVVNAAHRLAGASLALLAIALQ